MKVKYKEAYGQLRTEELHSYIIGRIGRFYTGGSFEIMQNEIDDIKEMFARLVEQLIITSNFNFNQVHYIVNGRQIEDEEGEIFELIKD